MILCQQNLNIMIHYDYQGKPWIIGIQPCVFSFKPNDTSRRVHGHDLHKATWIAQATLFRAVFEACRCVLLTVHLMRTDGVVYMKIFEAIERWMCRRWIWLKYMKS